jgi:hypothetical protein
MAARVRAFWFTRPALWLTGPALRVARLALGAPGSAAGTPVLVVMDRRYVASSY